MSTSTAKYLKDVEPGLYAGEARVYEVTPPFRGAKYLVTSTVTEGQSADSLGASLGADLEAETAVFPATEDGAPDFGVFFAHPGWSTFTLKGVLDHEGVLRKAGIEVQA